MTLRGDAAGGSEQREVQSGETGIRPRWLARVVSAAEADRRKALAAAAAMTAAIALGDWLIEHHVSIGYLYILPILTAAAFLTRWQIVAFAMVCAVLRETLDAYPDDFVLAREIMVVLAFASSGLLFKELAGNRRQAIEHARELERHIVQRRDAEEQLNVLFASTPAGIFIVGEDGLIISTNEAAARIVERARVELPGCPIGDYLPELGRVRITGRRRFFRTMMECTGRRSSGEPFIAEVWFSTYATALGRRLAAIVVDLSDEFRSREDSRLNSLLATSRVMMGSVLHEIRNLSAAASMSHSNLLRQQDLRTNEDFQALGTLVTGLNRLASGDLEAIKGDEASELELDGFFQELRVVVEPLAAEIGGKLLFSSSALGVRVRGDRYSLLQVFLNLARNSAAAMAGRPSPVMRVEAALTAQGAEIRFRDSGPGIARPEPLFRAFHPAAEATGLGLYVSRAIVRSLGGELTHEPQDGGCCFVVKLQLASPLLRQPKLDGRHEHSSLDRR